MIYVHVPFCRSFCTYCDFYSERACPTEAWVEEVCREAIRRRDEIAASAAVDTLYFGGGTPSVLPLSYLGRIADACGGRRYAEWTMEVNPDDITPEYASGLRELGVNRVSMGVQSLDDGMLHWMNRRHSAEGARSAFRRLREAGFENISVDIIFGVGGMPDSMLAATVEDLLVWRPEHISAYQLSVEEGSALGRLAREGRYTELSDDACAAQYALLCSRLAAAGYEHYEISNWALPGRRALHNSAYWRRAPYVGLGPGAHSLRRVAAADAARLLSPCTPRGEGEGSPSAASQLSPLSLRSETLQKGGEGTKTADNVAERSENIISGTKQSDFVDELGVQGDSSVPAADFRSWNSEELSGWTSEGETLTPEQIREEEIMLGLRTAEGVERSFVAVAPQDDRADMLVPVGNGRLRIPEERWFVADDIIAGLI